MEDALAACKGLFSRFDRGDGLVPLWDVGVIVLALERAIDDAELRAILKQLRADESGALNLVGLCEVISYAMKGEPHTRDSLALNDPGGGPPLVVKLADVAAKQLKSLYTMHPTFDDQMCWLRTEEPLASHCGTALRPRGARAAAAAPSAVAAPICAVVHSCPVREPPGA